MVINKNNSITKIVILILVLLTFFGLKIGTIKQSNWDYLNMGILFIAFLSSIRFRCLYSKLIILCAICIFGSCVYSSLYNGQSFYLVVIHSFRYFSILFFIYLVKQQKSAKEAEKILITIAVFCCCCYIFQWLIFPTVIFYGADNEAKATLEYYRVRIPGSISCYGLFFYGVNHFLLGKKKLGSLYTILGFIPILIMGFRSMLGLSLICFFIMIPFVVKKTIKTIFYCLLGGISVFLIMQTDLVQSKISEMKRRNDANQIFENEDYVRWKELDYYWNEQFANPTERFIGGGVPTDPSSRYSQTIYGYAYEHNLYWDDLGLVGLSMIIGIPAVGILILLYSTCIWRCKEPHLQYIRFTLIVVLLGSLFTNSELYRQGNLLIFTLFLYIEYKYHKEHHLLK